MSKSTELPDPGQSSLPEDSERLLQQAKSALETKDYRHAEELVRAVLAQSPVHSRSLKLLANVYMRSLDFASAESVYRRLASLYPNDLDAFLGIANAAQEAGRFEEAIEIYKAILRVDPKKLAALQNLGNCLRDHGQLDDAIAVYRRALQLKPDYHGCALNYANALFFKEDWAEAWRLFEARLAVSRIIPPLSIATTTGGTQVAQEHWQKGPQPKSLLVVGEQGLGDNIQFVRFLPELARTGTQVTLITDRKLFALLGTLDPRIVLAPRHEEIRIEGIHAWTLLMSLPLALGMRPGGVAPKIPYLHADPERVKTWRSKIGVEGFKIGIAWQGNPEGAIDRGRSIPLALYAPLADIPGVRLISLQKGFGEEQISQIAFRSCVETLGPDFDSGPDAFVDAAAVMMCLDLVITTDTAIPHLAGALGRPFWALLKVGADWRWLRNREDSPFYPTARLFRQRTSGDWSEVMTRVADQLRRSI